MVTANKLAKGRSLLHMQGIVTIGMDASTRRWEGVFKKRHVQGAWSQEQNKLHINCLELEAVLLTMKHFLPQLRGQNVLIRSDNTTVIHLLIATKRGQFTNYSHSNQHRTEGSAHSRQTEHNSRSAQWRKDMADRMGAEQCSSGSDIQVWDKPFIDLFASFQNRKLKMFCIWDLHPEALAIYTLTIPWEGVFAYALPPIFLIPKALEHMKQFQCQIILIQM